MYVFATTPNGLVSYVMDIYGAQRVSALLRMPTDRYAIPTMAATGCEHNNEENETTVTNDDDDWRNGLPRVLCANTWNMFCAWRTLRLRCDGTTPHIKSLVLGVSAAQVSIRESMNFGRRRSHLAGAATTRRGPQLG